MTDTVALLANVAILVGLALVVYELDQNNDALIGDTQQGLLELLQESDAWLQDASFAEIVVKAEERGEPLTDVEARRYADWLSGKFNVCEHVYERFLEGTLTSYYWEGWDEGCRALLGSAQGRQVWSQRRDWYGRSFQDYFDDHLSRID